MDQQALLSIAVLLFVLGVLLILGVVVSPENPVPQQAEEETLLAPPPEPVGMPTVGSARWVGGRRPR